MNIAQESVVEVEAVPVLQDFAFKAIPVPKKSRLDWMKILAAGEWVAVKLSRGDLSSIALLFSEEGTIEVKGRGLGFGPDSVLVRLVPREFPEIGVDVTDTTSAEITRLMTKPTEYEQTMPVTARLGSMIEHLHRIKRYRAERRIEYTPLRLNRVD